MLEALRRGAQSWVAKILFAVLIVSFGIFWNVADVFRGFGRGSIAHVGKTEISVNEFQRAFQNDLRSISAESGQRISTEQALALQLDRQTLDRLIAQAALKTHAQELGLGLSDDELARGLREDPMFRGPDGKFSKLGYDGLLERMGLTEAGFITIRREDELRRQITDALGGAIVAPKPLVEDIHAFRDETRIIEHATIDASKAVTVAPADEAKLKATYESDKLRFMTPEYRKVALLILGVEDLKKEVKISDEEVKASYTDTKASYDKPERRRLQQIAFDDKAKAEEARTALFEGKKNFLEVAKEAGATENDVNLGMLTKAQVIDKKVAERAFALARDEISEVIDGTFKYVIVRAIEIDAGKESTFDEVKVQVRDKLAKSKAEGLMHDRMDLVEEGRNAGKTLKEIADSEKLRFIDVEATDADNKTPDGKAAIDYPDAAIVLREIFAATPGSEQDAVELPGDAFAWFNVESVTEAKQKPFDEVKEQVKQRYEEKERGRLLDELAAKLVDRLKGGEAIDKVAADANGKAETTEPLKRVVSPPGLTADAVKRAFVLPKGGAGFADTADGGSRIVFRVKDVVPAPAPDQAQIDGLASELKRELENELLIAYVDGLRTHLGASINETELKRVTGAETGQQ